MFSQLLYSESCINFQVYSFMIGRMSLGVGKTVPYVASSHEGKIESSIVPGYVILD